MRATFFNVGIKVERYADIVKRQVEAGHLIGNHTLTHPSNLMVLRGQALRTEITGGAAVIERITGSRPEFFRPPCGIISKPAFGVTRQEGCQVVLWSDSLSERRFDDADKGGSVIAERIKPGSIILTHDGGREGLDRSKIVEALPALIEGIQARGYRFVTLDEMPLPRSENL